MEERDLLAHAVAALERLNIPYFVTGSGVLRLCRSPIDYEYIQKWAQELDVVDIWQAILNRVQSDS